MDILFIDVGVETYTAKTFSSSRYEIWTMQSQYHNLPTVNGVCQQAGEQYRARDVGYYATENMAELSMDIAPAYPADAGIKKWFRRCALHREDQSYVEICDEFELREKTDDIFFSLMIACAHSIDNEKGIISLNLNGKSILIEFDKSLYSCESEYISIIDEKLLYVWGDHIYRIVFKAKEPLITGVWAIKIMEHHIA